MWLFLEDRKGCLKGTVPITQYQVIHSAFQRWHFCHRWPCHQTTLFQKMTFLEPQLQPSAPHPVARALSQRHSSVCPTRVPLGIGVTLSLSMEGGKPCSGSHLSDQEEGSEKPTPFSLQKKSEQRSQLYHPQPYSPLLGLTPWLSSLCPACQAPIQGPALMPLLALRHALGKAPVIT